MRFDRGASEWDPVVKLELEGRFVGMMACPWMIMAPRGVWFRRQRFYRCGMEASVILFPEPYGYRVYCEEGHCLPMPANGKPPVRRLKTWKD